jgi:hypothetical protein
LIGNLEREKEILVEIIQHLLLQLVNKDRVRTWRLVLHAMCKMIYKVLKTFLTSKYSPLKCNE